MSPLTEPAIEPVQAPGGAHTRDLLNRIHQDALRVLEEVGVYCTSPEIQNLLGDTGLAAYDESTGHLHVLTPLVEQALVSTPGRKDYWVSPNSFGVGGDGAFCFR